MAERLDDGHRSDAHMKRRATKSAREGNTGMTPIAGYSGTPLAKKLGIAEGTHVVSLAAPEHYRELLAPLPEGVVWAARVTAKTDIVHVFVTRAEDLNRRLGTLRQSLRPDAAVWVSWPKKSSGVVSNVNEQTVRDLALPLGFIDIKVCAVDAVWSGLKLVIRRNQR